MSPEFIYGFDDLLDVRALERLHLEICYGIAKSQTNMSSRVIPHYEMTGSFDDLLNFKQNENARISAVANEGAEHLHDVEELNYFSKLSHEQKKRFLQLYKKAYWDGEFVRLKFTKQENAKDQFATFYSSSCEWHPNAENFPQLLEFIKKLPFADIGRILIFVSYHYLKSDVHFDRKDNVFDGRHHFIWFNPFNQKKFFLIDDNNTKRYVKHKSSFFDTRCLHGADEAPQMTYTLRIDGQLNKDFCEKNNILWRPR